MHLKKLKLFLIQMELMKKQNCNKLEEYIIKKKQVLKKNKKKK